MPAHVDVERDVAVALLRSQFPEWADLPLEPVASAGTVNTLFRLGGDRVVRLPHRASDRRIVEKEHRWLPKLAPFLSLDIPVPLAIGEPSDDFAAVWSICTWLDGEDGWTRPLQDLHRAALDLAQFIAQLQGIDASDGPAAGKQNYFRGVPLVDLDSAVRRAIADSGDRVDGRAVTRAWDEALDQTLCTTPVWVHGDLQPGNQLSRADRLTAVIDFGQLGVGDPACDLLPAWNLLTPDTRPAFREALEVDEATWIPSGFDELTSGSRSDGHDATRSMRRCK